jgi:site-specific recombinase XerD
MPRKVQAKATGVWEKIPGSGVWWIRYRVDGRLKREKVGRKGDAIDLYQKRKSDIRAGVKLPDNMKSAGVKFKSLADAILTFSKAHHRDSRNIISRLAKVLPDFGERVADQIKPEEIDAWLTMNTQTPATSNRYRALFSLIYREALRNGKVTSNPARLVRQRHEENGRIRWLTDEEEARLRAVITEHFPEHLPELAISLGTGMRLTEQYKMCWNAVDFERREVGLSRTKNYNGRSIPMNEEVLAAFAELKARNPVAKKTDRVFEIENPRRWFSTALEHAGIANFRWHDCRHTFCSRLAMRGVNLKVIQTLAGHKTITMTARYAHLDDASLRVAVNSLAAPSIAASK